MPADISELDLSSPKGGLGFGSRDEKLTHLLALSPSFDRPPAVNLLSNPPNPVVPSAPGLLAAATSASIGRGSVGPEIVGLLRDERDEVLVLARGSVGETRLLEEAERLNHFVGREKKLERPPELEPVPEVGPLEGEAERVKDGRDGDCLTA